MKRSHWRIPLSFTSVVVMAAGVRATRVPSYQEVVLWEDSCDWVTNPDRDILDRHRNYITWPDTVSDYVDSDGSGSCSKVSYDDSACYPIFWTPVTSETRWEQNGDRCGLGLCRYL